LDNQETSVEVIARLAVEIAASLYGVTQHVYLFPSACSHVFRLEFDGGTGSKIDGKILKIARLEMKAISCGSSRYFPRFIFEASRFRESSIRSRTRS